MYQLIIFLTGSRAVQIFLKKGVLHSVFKKDSSFLKFFGAVCLPSFVEVILISQYLEIYFSMLVVAHFGLEKKAN